MCSTRKLMPIQIFKKSNYPISENSFHPEIVLLYKSKVNAETVYLHFSTSKENSSMDKFVFSTVRGHSNITSSKRWVGRVRKWQFLMIYSTVNHQRVGWVGLKKSKT